MRKSRSLDKLVESYFFAIPQHVCMSMCAYVHEAEYAVHKILLRSKTLM